MITYNDYIKRMEEKGYLYRSGNPIMINESDSMIKTFKVKKGSVGKILELQCPSNVVISLCGKTHEEGCDRHYSCDIKCFDNDDNEPFKDSHRSTPLRHDRHVVAEIIATKILYNEPPKGHKKIEEWQELISPILKMIKSEDPCQHVMLVGTYKFFNNDFVNTSFNLYENQKMTFYIVNPDTDIEKVKFNLKADIFERNDNVTFSGTKMANNKDTEYETIKQLVIESGSGYVQFQGFPTKENGYYVQQQPEEFAKAMIFLRSLNRTFEYGLDIGIGAGGTTKLLRDLLTIKNTLVIDNGSDKEYPHWQRIKQKLNSNLVVDIIGTSTTPNTTIALEPYRGKIDFLFIDADHSYLGVLIDYYIMLPLLSQNAIIMFHDTKHEEFGVKRFVEQLQPHKNIKHLKTISIHDGITILEKIL